MGIMCRILAGLNTIKHAKGLRVRDTNSGARLLRCDLHTSNPPAV